MDHRRLAASLVLAVTMTGTAGLPGAGAQSEPAARTTVSDVAPVRLPSGITAQAAYSVTHEALQDVPGGAGTLPGARIDRAEHPEALEGLWGEAASSGSWLAPRGRWQLEPRSSFVENVYVRGARHEDAAPLAAGDRIEVSMTSDAGHALAPWNAARGKPDGELAWEAASHARTVSADYGDVSGEIDVVHFTANVVARGGDVDARTAPGPLFPETALVESVVTPLEVTTDWLEIDLPRSYPLGTDYLGVLGVATPFTRYVDRFEWRVNPDEGTMRIRAHVRGWIPEARMQQLTDGVGVGRWYLPLRGVIAFDPNGGQQQPLAPRAQLELPAGGLALVASARDAVEEVEVAPGGVVRAGSELGTEVLDLLAPSPAAEEAPAAGGGTLADSETEAAAAVDHGLDETVTLTGQGGRFEFTVDPDLRGQGVLGLRAVRHRESDTTFALTATVPAVVVDGQAVLLERSRLTDLRVLPTRIAPVQTSVLHGSSRTPVLRGGAWVFEGFTVDAVYDLGAGRHARVGFTAPVAYRPGLPDPTAGDLLVEVEVWGLDGEPVAARPVTLVELPVGGPVTVGGQTYTTEFQEAVGTLTVADRRVVRSWNGPGAGVTTVVNAPAPLTPAPQPDPSRALGDGSIAVLYAPPPDAAALAVVSSSMRVDMLNAPVWPVSDPPPLGAPCGTPQVVDQPLPPAAPEFDIQTAWFDADDANLYATIELDELPEEALPATQVEYALSWGFAHRTETARALLDPDGQWTFRYRNRTMEGEASAGPPALIRMTVPRSLIWAVEGDLLRDPSAHARIVTLLWAEEVDHAPPGSSPGFGLGDDYELGAC